MSTRKLTQRLPSVAKKTSRSLGDCRLSSSSFAVKTRIPKDSGEFNVAPQPRYAGVIRRFLHERSIIWPKIQQIPTERSLMDQLWARDMLGERIQLDGIAPPMKTTEAVSGEEEVMKGLTVEDARKLMRAAQIEAVRSRLRETGKTWVPYAEFIQICSEACSDPDQGSKIAKILDDSGNVIVLGKFACLSPDQVTKSIEGLLPLPHVEKRNDPRREELNELEAKRAMINKKAQDMVRKELWAGLGYLIIQTVGLMRLTFWELTWDVMEPICFYLTSAYFMCGYAFFLRTSKEPSFEGFYQSRVEAKQKKLINHHEFDLTRYQELKQLFCPQPSPSPALHQLVRTT